MRFTYTTTGKDLIERQSDEDVRKRRLEVILASCISIVLFLIVVLIAHYLSGKCVNGGFIIRNLFLGAIVSLIVVIFRSNTAKLLLSEKYRYNVCNFEAAELSEYYLQIDENSISFTQAEDMCGIILNDNVTVKFEDIAYSVYPVYEKGVQSAGKGKLYLKLVMKKGNYYQADKHKKKRRSLVVDLRAYQAEEILDIRDIRSRIRLK